MSVDKMLWVSIKKFPFVPKSIIDGVSVNKAPKNWIEDETKKAYYDLKVK